MSLPDIPGISNDGPRPIILVVGKMLKTSASNGDYKTLSSFTGEARSSPASTGPTPTVGQLYGWSM